MYGVGQSKARSWRSCHRAYHYKYEEQLIRKRTKRPFMFGRIVHRMIEAEAQDEDPFEILQAMADDVDNQKLFTAEKEMYGDIITDIGVIMRDYFDYHTDGLRFVPVKDETGEYRYSEHEFAVPLNELIPSKGITIPSGGVVKPRDAEGILFKGQVDGLGKTPNKLRWLMEHKTFDKMPGDDERWRNLQTVVYRRVALYLGWMPEIDGIAWNYIMSKAPTVPQLLKDGKRLSVQQIVTLPSVVEATLKVHGLKREGHEKLIERAEASRDNYFQRIYTPVSTVVADKIFAGFVETAIEMRDNHGKKRNQNIGRHCSWCDYEPLCRADLTGGDEDFVRDGEFVIENPEGYRRSGRNEGKETKEAKQRGDSSDRVLASTETRGKRTPKLRVLRTKRDG